MQPDVPAAEGLTLPTTVADAVAIAVDGLDALAALGEDVEDEWQYVQDLSEAWQSRLAEVEAARGTEALDEARGAAIARVSHEARSIGDPHRAIDWLSTLPQVVLVALGERP
ncbi:MAG TPA: hypothetical protein VFV72_04320 [Candidatus Limnocylindrales bacterium]|nr:hypothetical protein [Candidatus Limnocylindrales bacterium]